MKAKISLAFVFYSFFGFGNNLDDLVMEALKDAKAMQVFRQGYPEPKNYSVEIDRLHGQYAVTRAHDGQITTTIDKFVGPKELPSFMHHELSHACQMTLGGPSRSLFMDEASATLQEILGLGSTGTWQRAASEFQRNPHVPPFVDSKEIAAAEIGAEFQYGGALFLMFLDQEHGAGDGIFIRKLWSKNASRLKHLANSGWVRVIEQETGKSFGDLILEFARFRLKHPSLKYLSVSLKNKAREVSLPKRYLPLPLGCVVLRFAPDSAQNFSLIIDSPYKKGISFSKYRSKIEKESSMFRLQTGEVKTKWQIDDNETLFVSICNLDIDAFFKRDLKSTSLRIMLAHGEN